MIGITYLPLPAAAARCKYFLKGEFGIFQPLFCNHILSKSVSCLS